MASASAPKFAGAGGCDEMRRLASKDASAPRQECPFGGNVPVWCRPLRRALVRELADQRDKVMADLIACVCGCTLPAAACVFAVDGYGAHAWVVHVAGSVYLILNSVIFMQRFVLMLHYSEHRGLWRKRGTGHASSALRALVPCLCPFFGVPPGIYRLHHCVMHHVENNVGLDFSSTTRFRRDSPMHFLAYYASMVAGIIMLPAYALATGRIDLALRSMAGFVSYGCVVFVWCCKPPGNDSSWLGNDINHQPSDIFYRLRYHHCIVSAPPMRQCAAFGVISCFIWTLCQFCPTATAYVFLLPLLIITVALSLGNWSQHIFINHSHYADGRAGADGRAEDNPMTIDSYCMSYICTETEENQKTFNDGYHTVHHGTCAAARRLAVNDERMQQKSKSVVAEARISPTCAPSSAVSDTLGRVCVPVTLCRWSSMLSIRQSILASTGPSCLNDSCRHSTHTRPTASLCSGAFISWTWV